MKPTLNNKIKIKIPSSIKGKESAVKIDPTEFAPIKIPMKIPINTAGRNSQRLTVI
jgi:hypothetical protein